MIPQFNLALADPVADLPAVERGEGWACEFAPGLSLLGHQGIDIAAQNIGFHVVGPVFEKKPPSSSPANSLNMVNETLTAFTERAWRAGRDGTFDRPPVR